VYLHGWRVQKWQQQQQQQQQRQLYMSSKMLCSQILQRLNAGGIVKNSSLLI
jgi:hypothetical protein